MGAVFRKRNSPLPCALGAGSSSIEGRESPREGHRRWPSRAALHSSQRNGEASHRPKRRRLYPVLCISSGTSLRQVFPDMQAAISLLQRKRKTFLMLLPKTINRSPSRSLMSNIPFKETRYRRNSAQDALTDRRIFSGHFPPYARTASSSNISSPSCTDRGDAVSRKRCLSGT